MSTPMATGTQAQPNAMAATAGAAAGLTVWLALRVLRFDHVTTVVRWLARNARRDATSAEILRTLRAIDAGSRFVPVRVACLERSLAAVMLLATWRRGARWHMGLRTPPITSHAWVTDSGGEPIGEQASVMAYRTMLMISPRQHTLGETRD
jgi:hypothetical protein